MRKAELQKEEERQQTASAAVTGPGRSQILILHHVCAGDQGGLIVLSQLHDQGTGLELEQLGLKPAPIRDIGSTDSSLIYRAITLTLFLLLLF